MEHLKNIKSQLMSCVESQMSNLANVDTHELGEAIDMIKDIYTSLYYCSVVEAMEEAEEQEKNGNTVYYTERYLPVERYMPRMYRENPHDMGRSDRMNYYDRSRSYYDGKGNDYGYTPRTVQYNNDMPYYDYQEPVARDLREGRSPLSRRRYMESKEQHKTKEVQLQELEKYMAELSQDMTEMIADATPEEKQMLHKKLSTLTSKIELLTKG